MPPRSKLPTLAEWLDGRDRGEAFEEFVSETMAMSAGVSTDDQSMLRILRTLGIAIVEAARREDAEDTPRIDVVARLARATGYMLFNTVLSSMRDGVPLERVAKIIRADIREGIDEAVAAARRDRAS